MRMKNTRVSSLTKKRRKAQANKVGLALEHLEDRQLLTASWANFGATTVGSEDGSGSQPTIEFSPATTGSTTVSLAITTPLGGGGVTPAESSDFTLTSFTVGSGVTSVGLIDIEALKITNDQLVEGTEAIGIQIVGSTVGVDGATIMTHHIEDNETARVEIGNSINEGSGGPTIKLVTSSPEKDGDNNKPAFLEDSFTVSVKDVAGGTATVGSESNRDVFPIPDQTVTFAASSGNGTQVGFQTNTRSDSLLEGTETVLFDLVPSLSHIGVGSETLNINDAQSVSVSFSRTSDMSFENAQSGDKFVDVILNLPQGGSLVQDIVVPVTIGGTARIAEVPSQANNDGQDDFTIEAPALPISNNVQNITFPAGSANNSRITYRLDTQSGLRGDAILEGDETVRLSLSKPRLGSSTGTEVGTVSGGAYTLTIRDDESGTIKVERVAEKVAEESGSVQFKFTVTPTGGSSISGIGPIAVPYTLGGTTLPQVSDPADDYFKDYNQGRNGTFTIGNSNSPVFATELVRNLTISLTDDNVVEGDETISISVGSTNGLSVTGSGATTTVTDGDTTTASVVLLNSTAGGDLDAKEDDCDFGSVDGKNNADCTSDDARFRIDLGAPVSTDVRIELEATGTATSGTDYRAFDQFITIPAGKTSTGTITLEIFDDQIIEGREEIGIKIKEVNKDFGDQDVGKGTVEGKIGIADTPDRGNLTLTASDPIARESSGGVDNGQFLFQLDKQVGVPVVISYSVSTGGQDDATPDVDYTELTGTATIAPNSFATAVNVQVIDDGIDEGNENVTITITNVTASGISVATSGTPQLKYTASDSDTVVITDTDDDVQVSVVVKDGNAGEKASANDSDALGDGVFEVKLSNASADQVKVKYEFSGSASGADFNRADLLGSGELIFSPGSTLQTFTYEINDDTLIEGNETLVLTLKDPTNASLGTSSGTITIVDNDSSDVIFTSVGPTAEAGVGNNKSDSNNPRGRFQFSLNDESTSDTTVFFTLGGLAENGTDYTIFTEDPTNKDNPAVLSLSGNSGSIVLPKNSTAAKQLWVVGKSDNLIEGDEPVTITLNGTSNGSIKAEGSRSILIADDDSALVSLKKVDDEAFENPSDGGTTAQFRLEVRDADGDLTTNVVRDMQVQYSLITTSSKPAATQSHNGTVGDVTIGNATSTSENIGFINVSAQQNEVIIPISVVNDSLVEGTEELTMQLIGIVSETTLAGVGFDPVANNATAEIIDDDTGAQVFLAFQSSSNVVANEENPNDTVPILVGLTQPSSRNIPVTVTVGSTGNRADAEFSNNPSNNRGIGHDDFWIAGSNSDGSVNLNDQLNPTLNQVTGRYEYSITVPRGQQSAVVHVVPINDNTGDAGTGVVEGPEFVNIRLAENAAGSIYTNSLASSEINPQIFETDRAIIRISDHDSTTDEAGSSVPENTDTEATVTLGRDVEGELDVFYRYTNGTAVAGSDFNASTGSYRFVNQSTGRTNVDVAPSQPLKIDLINDGVFEGSEKFKIELFAQHNNGGLTDQASFTSGDFASVQILDDDQISIDVNTSVTENNTNLPVAITLNGGASSGVYEIEVEGISASENADFDAPFSGNTDPFEANATWNGSSWSSSFDSDGDSRLEFNIGINEDTIVEGNQTFRIRVIPPSGSSVSTTARTVTIVDEDTAKIEAKNVTVQEGQNAAIEVTTDKQIEGTLTFDLDVLQATATEDTDNIDGDFAPYSKQNISITGNGPGTASDFVTSGFNDTIVEGNETATITLTNVKFNGKAPSESNANFNVNNGTVTISEDNQESVRFDVNPTSVEVTEGGNVSTKVKLVYENGATGSVGFTVAPQLNNGTATGADFSLTTGSLEFSGANNQEMTVIVQTLNDDVVEATENFSISFPKDNITSDTGAKFADNVNSVAVTLKDNDSATVEVRGAVDGAEGGEDGSFVIGYANGKTTDVDVFVSLTASGTATPGNGLTVSGDYLLTDLSGNPLLGSNPPNYIAVIPANANSTTIRVDVNDDGIDEGDETVVITEGGVIPGATRSNISSGGNSVSLTIADDDGVIIPTNRSFAVRGTAWSSSVGSVAVTNGTNVPNSGVNIIELTYTGTIPLTAPALVQISANNPTASSFAGSRLSYVGGVATYEVSGVGATGLPSGRYQITAADAGGITEIDFDLQVSDASGNDTVDFADFAALASTFGATSTAGQAPLPADFNANGRVDFGDFALLAGNFGASIAGLPVPVPPASEDAGLAAVAMARATRDAMFSDSVDDIFGQDEDEDIFG